MRIVTFSSSVSVVQLVENEVLRCVEGGNASSNEVTK